MQKYILFIWTVLLGLVACSKDESYQIEGKLTQLQDPTLYVVFETKARKQLIPLPVKLTEPLSSDTKRATSIQPRCSSRTVLAL